MLRETMVSIKIGVIIYHENHRSRVVIHYLFVHAMNGFTRFSSLVQSVLASRSSFHDTSSFGTLSNR